MYRGRVGGGTVMAGVPLPKAYTEELQCPVCSYCIERGEGEGGPTVTTGVPLPKAYAEEVQCPVCSYCIERGEGGP